MKLRYTRTDSAGNDERPLEDEVRRLAAGEGKPEAPPDVYWQNLLVRTNARIDDATSPRALSISWAARVAIPGVMAILSFLIGLHYYAPDVQNAGTSVAAVVRSMPSAEVDSLLSEPERTGTSFSAADFEEDVFHVPRVQIEEYIIDQARPLDVLGSMPDDQVTEVLAALQPSTDKSY
jgi:hypothetical protein